MANIQVKRPDTPLANTPKPITIGRLKEVRDSLRKDSKIDMESANSLKNDVKYRLIPTSQTATEYTEQAKTYSNRAQEKAKNASKYNKIINKATKK